MILKLDERVSQLLPLPSRQLQASIVGTYSVIRKANDTNYVVEMFN